MLAPIYLRKMDIDVFEKFSKNRKLGVMKTSAEKRGSILLTGTEKIKHENGTETISFAHHFEFEENQNEKIIGEHSEEELGENEEFEDSDLKERNPAPIDTHIEEFKFPKESRVGQSLTTKTTKRVVLTVLSLLFLIPMFSYEYWFEIKHHYIFDLAIFKAQIDHFNMSHSEI